MKKIVFYGEPMLEELLASFGEQYDLPYSVEFQPDNELDCRFVLFCADQPADQLLLTLKTFVEAWSSAFGIVKVPEQYRIRSVSIDWASSWKRFFHGKRAAKTLYIHPPWEEPSSDPELVSLRIDPGASFGTGHHPTTELCLEYMEQLVIKDAIVLDAGCGSGVLAIAAAKLGAFYVFGFDNDPEAVHQAEKNCALNLLKNAPRFMVGTIRQLSQFTRYPLMYVNMLPKNFLPDLPFYKRLLKKKGIAVFSGILKEHADSVLRSLRNAGFLLINRKEKGDWVAFQMEATA